MTDEPKVQFSTKFGDYDEAMLVFRADSPEELNALVAQTEMTVLLDLMTTLAAVKTVSTTPPRGSTSEPAKSEPTSDDEVDYSKNKDRCKHGKRKHVKKATFEAYFCSLKQGHPDQCDPVWEND